MSYQIAIHQHGDTSVFTKEPLSIKQPNAHQVVIEHQAIGLNFIDVYHRQGLYPLTMPAVIGQEAAGVITEIGEAVQGFKVGDRVAYAGYFGAYATHNIVDTHRLIQLPENVSYEQAAASLLKGGTASYLLHDTFEVKHSHIVLIHAGAGGVGQILIKWAKKLGATVITTVGSAEKMPIVTALGADLVINYSKGDLVQTIKQHFPKGVDVVYDGVGKVTFQASIDSLKPRGMMVSYGNASGAPPAITPLELLQKGSLFLTRPNLNNYTLTHDEFVTVAGRWLDLLGEGSMSVSIGGRFKLEDVAEAHEVLEARQIIGSAILVP